jgi:Thioredoxin like C-terminal domain
LSRRVAHTYEAPDSLRVNDWALSGDWTAEAESVFSNEPNGRIAFRFHTRDVNLVMGPRKADSPVAFRSRSTATRPTPRSVATRTARARGCSTSSVM